jgi:hypothetical protein
VTAVKWRRCEECGRDSIPVERVPDPSAISSPGGSSPAAVPEVEIEGVCENRRCPSKWQMSSQE